MRLRCTLEKNQVKEMKKLLLLMLAGVVILMSCNVPVQSEKIKVITEDYPPYNYADAQGNIVGQSTDIVRAIMSQVDDDSPIEIMPWEQGYGMAQEQPNVALYSVARTGDREHLFMWVGPIGSYENWLYAKKGSSIHVNSLDEAKTVGKIAAVKDEAGQQELAAQGFINFVYTDSTTDGLKKLVSGDADLWLGTSEGIASVATEAGVNPDDLQPAVYVYKADLFLAFNKNTAFSTVEAWQKALDSLKK
jgi:polar amino acid transport system substrate-binding protein